MIRDIRWIRLYHVVHITRGAYAMSMTSVGPSVTLADCDHIVQQQEGLAVASIARNVVVEMTPPRDDNAQ